MPLWSNWPAQIDHEYSPWTETSKQRVECVCVCVGGAPHSPVEAVLLPATGGLWVKVAGQRRRMGERRQRGVRLHDGAAQIDGGSGRILATSMAGAGTGEVAPAGAGADGRRGGEGAGTGEAAQGRPGWRRPGRAGHSRGQAVRRRPGRERRRKGIL
jgi:hypothetical protein